ncbi:MAG TPA: OmpA family protein [Allosphingosinicella sp.]|jgi:outer membrane protein OmpA-like peptidoglycan-associated protein
MTNAEAQAYVDAREIDDRFARLIAYCRASLPLSPADLERIERIKLLLVARGIEPDDDDALAWLSPALCTNAEEQRHFHRRFDEYRRQPPEAPKTEDAPKPIEASRQSSRLRAFLRREALLFGGVPLVVLVLVLAARLIPGPPEQTQSPPGAAGVDGGAGLAPGAAPVATQLEPNGPAVAVLILAAVAAAALFLWMRRRRERLLDHFEPSPHSAAASVLAGGTSLLFSAPWLARTFGMLRRHKEAPSRRIDARRSIEATVRAGGRPEIRFGLRPATPEYLLLADRQSPRDHLLVVGDALQQQFAKEGIVASRYDHVGKPDRLRPVPAADARPVTLSDAVALHEGARVIALAEPRDCAGQSQASPWRTMFAKLDQPTLLDPRGPRRWTALERELEEDGVLVVPATPEGLGWYAEAINLRGLKWPGRWPASNAFEEDPVDAFFGDRKRLLDDRPPAPERIAELLVDLRHSLGGAAFRLLCATAVYPAVEPAFTLHVATRLPTGQDGPLLSEATWLAVARLPWMRLGHLPPWLRAELIRELDPETLAATTALVQAFVLPKTATDGTVAGPGDGWDEHERVRLLNWIGRNPESELYDPMLFDALRGVPPDRIGPRDPGRPGLRLSIWRSQDAAVAAALAAVLAALALTNPPLVDAPVRPPVEIQPETEPTGNLTLDGRNPFVPAPGKPPAGTTTGGTGAGNPASVGTGAGNTGTAELGTGNTATGGLGTGNTGGGGLGAGNTGSGGPGTQKSNPTDPVPNRRPQNSDGPYTVNFAPDSIKVDAAAAKNLDVVAERWNRIDEDHPVVLVIGHTDREGSDAYNVEVSQRMAGAVRAYLTQRGVDAQFIQTMAFGESRPLVPTADGVREPQNRRVEIYFQYSFGPEGEPTNTTF